MMTGRFLLAIAAMATVPSAAAADSGTGPNANPATAEALVSSAAEVLALEEERYRRLTLPVMVEGAGPYAFMIDTGSQATAITQEIRAALSLAPAGTATLVGMASRRTVDLATVERIDFGRNSFTDFTAPVLERTHVGADGILGLDALQDFRVLIDFRQQTIAVEDAVESKPSGRFEIVVRARRKLGQLLITDALVEGVRATVIIDTGAQASLGNTALLEKLRARRMAEIVTTDVNGVDLAGDLAYVRALTIEGLSLSNVALTFADTPAFAALGLEDKPVLSLGMQHLAIFDRVAIDFAKQRVLFDVPPDVARAMRAAKRGNVYRPNM